MSILCLFIVGVLLIKIACSRVSKYCDGLQQSSNTRDTISQELHDDAMSQINIMLEALKHRDIETEKLVGRYTHLSNVTDRSLALNIELLRENDVPESAIERIILELKDKDSQGSYKTFTHRFRVVLKEKSSK